MFEIDEYEPIKRSKEGVSTNPFNISSPFGEEPFSIDLKKEIEKK